MDKEDRILDAQDVAEMLRVKKSWVYDQTRAGLLPALKLGRYYRYRESEIRSWLEGLSSGPRTA